jgi:S1-C subfamily serine protease
MSLADTVARVRSGLFQIAAITDDDEYVGAGSAFLTNNLIVTNNHVFAAHRKVARVGIRRDDMPPQQWVTLSSEQFAGRLVTGSTEQSYDYAVLRLPELVNPDDYQFSLERPGARRIGDKIALLGFPLEHDNLTCHEGIISSFYQSGIADVIQLDASVNAGNSGGPLVDPETAAVIGIVTRKATGLTSLFGHLRQSLESNIAMVGNVSGGIRVGGLDIVDAVQISQRQILLTLNEIERQSNVGIGYAFSAHHLLNEPCMQVDSLSKT